MTLITATLPGSTKTLFFQKIGFTWDNGKPRRPNGYLALFTEWARYAKHFSSRDEALDFRESGMFHTGIEGNSLFDYGVLIGTTDSYSIPKEEVLIYANNR